MAPPSLESSVVLECSVSDTERSDTGDTRTSSVEAGDEISQAETDALDTLSNMAAARTLALMQREWAANPAGNKRGENELDMLSNQNPISEHQAADEYPPDLSPQANDSFDPPDDRFVPARKPFRQMIYGVTRYRLEPA